MDGVNSSHPHFAASLPLARTFLAISAFAACLFAWPITSWAFSVQGGKWPQANLGDPVTITYSYSNLLDGGLIDPDGNSLPVDLLRASIEEALGLWASVAPLHFVEVEDEGRNPVDFNNYPNGQFGQIRFKHIFINGPDIPGQQPRAKAQAYFPGSGGNRAGDVFYDNGDRWQAIGTLSQPDILGATVHELGHSLGLGHSSIPEANMFWIFNRSSGLGTGALHQDDINGILAVYGAGTGSVTPLAIPEPATLVLVLLTMALFLAIGQRKQAIPTSL